MSIPDQNSNSRREFIKKSALGASGIVIGGMGLTAKSYARIIGSNEMIRVAVVGVNSRGGAHIAAVNKDDRATVSHICDVDSLVLEKAMAVARETGNDPKGVKDFRKLVEMKDVDVITIATPEHWHAPMAIMGVKAGKHVYVEKPSSHNIYENELLVKAYKETGKLVQMGNQQRSATTSIEAVQKMKEGAIGKLYHGRAWYAATRGPIGFGKLVQVPTNLDWDLWQGPAPRRDYKDNIVHYNWHWFRHWGTGEVLNNGLHEFDVCRWAMGLEYPEQVESSGGRFFFEDDWEFFDHQHVVFKYPGGLIITWEGNSCNGQLVMGRGRGVIVYGTEGSMLLDRNGYVHYDKAGKIVAEVKEAELSATMNTVGAGNLDTQHFSNFFDAIQGKDKLHSPINEGALSVNMGHLANIAQFNGGTLKINTSTGEILENPEAQKMVKRAYEPGWRF